MVMRHFESGRKIHVYNVCDKAQLMFTIKLDKACYQLNRNPGENFYLSMCQFRPQDLWLVASRRALNNKWFWMTVLAQ